MRLEAVTRLAPGDLLRQQLHGILQLLDLLRVQMELSAERLNSALQYRYLGLEIYASVAHGDQTYTTRPGHLAQTSSRTYRANAAPEVPRTNLRTEAILPERRNNPPALPKLLRIERRFRAGILGHSERTAKPTYFPLSPDTGKGCSPSRKCHAAKT